jgi:redox-sensitive bicupin YhaK (pirin superfamily)
MRGAVLGVRPLGFPWPCADPFLFCVHHQDGYPAGNERLGPRASLAGRNLGQDFAGVDGWRMYHGTVVPGFPQHPHRGFETVTIVYDGEVDHRDSSGGGGRIAPGDVQWMTAAGGLVHEEFHSPDFARRGGRFEMVQLWVNLPAKAKMTPPRYQGIRAAQIPRVDLPDGAGNLRVIAGAFGDAHGPARTVTPMNIWDLALAGGTSCDLRVPAGHTAIVVVLSGTVTVGADTSIDGPGLALLERAGDSMVLRAGTAAKLLFLGGEPIREPVVAYGPFVMNAAAEIQQAMLDFQDGKMGQLGTIEGSEIRAGG